MPYERSPYGHGAPMLLAAQARGMGAQILGATSVSCRKTNRDGAFYISKAGYGSVMLVDAHVLDLTERRALNACGCAGVEDATVAVSPKRDEIVSFRSPYSEKQRSLTVPFYSMHVTYGIPLFQMRDDRWCFAALHADILPKGRTMDEALDVYDTKYAKSSHDKLAMRQIIEDRRR